MAGQDIPPGCIQSMDSCWHPHTWAYYTHVMGHSRPKLLRKSVIKWACLAWQCIHLFVLEKNYENLHQSILRWLLEWCHNKHLVCNGQWHNNIYEIWTVLAPQHIKTLGVLLATLAWVWSYITYNPKSTSSKWSAQCITEMVISSFNHSFISLQWRIIVEEKPMSGWFM